MALRCDDEYDSQNNFSQYLNALFSHYLSYCPHYGRRVQPPVMSTDDPARRKLAWNWLWFLPLCLAVVFLVEGHTVPYAFGAFKFAYQRWSWAALISPSTYFCFSVITASVWAPLRGLKFISIVVTSDDETRVRKRYLYVFLLAAAIFAIPFITDALIWGSFPLGFDNDGVLRLRMIPFVPWPEGHYGEF
jgi:hypothetical protein